MATIILTPQGLLSFSISQKYRFDDILDLNDMTIKEFVNVLQLSDTHQSIRYKVLYSLALNNLLIVPSPSPLEWVQKSRIFL